MLQFHQSRDQIQQSRAKKVVTRNQTATGWSQSTEVCCPEIFLAGGSDVCLWRRSQGGAGKERPFHVACRYATLVDKYSGALFPVKVIIIKKLEVEFLSFTRLTIWNFESMAPSSWKCHCRASVLFKRQTNASISEFSRFSSRCSHTTPLDYCHYWRQGYLF